MNEAILRKCRESMEVKAEFFRREADRIGALCRAMAESPPRAGGRLFAMGNGGSACDAGHVAVEFTHPIIAKGRPLPALALTNDSPLLTAVGNDTDFSRVYYCPSGLDAFVISASSSWTRSAFIVTEEIWRLGSARAASRRTLSMPFKPLGRPGC